MREVAVTPQRGAEARLPLTRVAVIEAAVAVADAGGVAAISMRSTGRQLGVEAMSLYHHVANKQALLEGVVEWIFDGIWIPEPAEPWREAMARRATSARSVFAAHPWALGLLESQPTWGEAALRHHESVLANLRAAGCSLVQAAHAFSVLDSYTFGFVLSETSMPFDGSMPEEFDAYAAGLAAGITPHTAPNVLELIALQSQQRVFHPDTEFELGLTLILDGLERLFELAPTSLAGDESTHA